MLAGSLAGFGNSLGPFGGETSRSPLTYDVAFGPGATESAIVFDRLVLDTWDGVGNR
jgi:hypothetical protein